MQSSWQQRSELWKKGYSQQARTLLKIHDRIRDSELFRASLAKYRVAHPEHVPLLDALSAGALLSTVMMPDAVPRKSSHRRSNRHPRRRASEVTPSEAYNVTYDPCTADYTRGESISINVFTLMPMIF